MPKIEENVPRNLKTKNLKINNKLPKNYKSFNMKVYPK